MQISRRDFLALGGAAAGSALNGPAKEGAAMWSAFETPRRRGEKESIFDTRIGSYLPPRPLELFRKRRELVDRVVIVGETHTNPLHHRAELEVIHSLHTLEPQRPLVIGLEHFYRKHQGYLDSFVSGQMSLTKLYELTHWDKTFGYEFGMWTPIFNYCQKHNIRMVGLNLPHQVVHLVSQMGLENVPKALRDLLPEMDLNNQSHLARFTKNMGITHASAEPGNHGFGLNSVAFKRYYEAATLWDEYMAESASQWLQQNESQNGRMVVLAGSAHVAGRDGIPDRITRRTGCSCFTIVPQGVQWVDHNPLVKVPPRRDIADWVWFTQREVDLV
eukprot:CAMPEP_0198727580 /NCGR_PEP_ID=MMETSP1475-20131203/4521_1 /TAXON_ID= ORGANISM="Unidentified sp., Strain CCMP1999" /NCGR_SAMPLE_ID=MMETSP1475 /ASSEMBLY_ACC=CAM_ASM_001111 /LENGTH=330 /DNA_ID=CAMNT_0044489637 /DNA_START=149 /DNA_END=1141 /DNA_ORIENTATION=+